jgi:hypothetical protein
MEDASEHCAEVSRGIISKIMGDRGHGLPHRQLFQSKHQSVLAPADRERHARIAKKQACERTFTGAGFLGPALKGAIVVGRLSQSLHDTKNPTILSVGNNQGRLPDDRYAVEKKANEAHFGRMGIHIPRDVDRDVQKLSAERVEMKTDALGWKRTRDNRRWKQAAKSDGARVSHPMLDSGWNPYCAVRWGDPKPVPRANRSDAADNRDQLTSVVSMCIDASWSVLVPRHAGDWTVSGVWVGVDREQVGSGVDVHLVSSSVFDVGLGLLAVSPPAPQCGARNGPASTPRSSSARQRERLRSRAQFMRASRLKLRRQSGDETGVHRSRVMGAFTRPARSQGSRNGQRFVR